jgi:hypothetical protein
MHALSALQILLSALPLLAFASHSHRDSHYYYQRKLHATRSTCNRSNKTTLKLADLYQGSTFLEYVSSCQVVFDKTNHKIM